MATEQPPQGKRRALHDAVFADGLGRVLGAGRDEAAGGREERRDEALVAPKQQNRDPARQADELRALQTKLDPLGQKLCFHPVAADYAPIDGVAPVEYLLEAMPALQLCLDLYHLNRSGYSMPDWIRAHAGRVCMVHFKDGKDGRLTPAGQGDTDWRGVAKACVEAGVDYAFVEQETWDRDPFVCLGEALAWLNGQLA